MTETARVLLTAAVLSATGIGAFALRVSRIDPAAPERLIGELRVAQMAAIVLAALGAVPIGLAIGATPGGLTHIDAAIGVGFVILSGFVLLRDPRAALWLAAAGFIAHALVDVAHRPGWLRPDLAPRWYIIGCATYDVYFAGICYWARRGRSS